MVTLSLGLSTVEGRESPHQRVHHLSSSGRSDMVQAALTLSWRQAKSLCFCQWPCLLLVSMTWKRQLAFSKEGVALKPYVFSSLLNINSRFFSNGLISNTGNLDLLRSQLIVRSLTFFFFFFFFFNFDRSENWPFVTNQNVCGLFGLCVACGCDLYGTSS